MCPVPGVPDWPGLLQRDGWADAEGDKRERNTGSAESERRGGRRWKAWITQTFLEQFYVNTILRNERRWPLSSVRPSGFFLSLAASYFLTLILWDCSLRVYLFSILHLLCIVGTFCFRVALQSVELRLGGEVTLALVPFKGCCRRVFDWYGANRFCFALPVLRGRLCTWLRGGFCRRGEEPEEEGAASSLGNRCKVWIVSELISW